MYISLLHSQHHHHYHEIDVPVLLLLLLVAVPAPTRHAKVVVALISITINKRLQKEEAAVRSAVVKRTEVLPWRCLSLPPRGRRLIDADYLALSSLLCMFGYVCICM
jgi:hypothetical protein